MTKEIVSNMKKAKNEIKLAKRIAIFSHISLDMDCLGSMFALAQVLLNLGKHVEMFNEESLAFEDKFIVDETSINKCGLNPEEFDLFISVDTASSNRLGIFKDKFLNFPNTIKFDHHIRLDDYALINIVEPEMSSCSELMFHFFKFAKFNITPNIATYLYAGISSDTHSFRNGATTVSVLEVAPQLCKLGADFKRVNDALYYNNSRLTMEMKKLFMQKYKIYDNQIAICTISLDDLKKVGASKSDCSSFSAELATIEGINISCNIVQKDETHCSASFRSRNGYDVSIIANILGGGGHVNAAAAVVEISDEKLFTKMVLKEIRLYIEKEKKNV